MIQRIQTIFLLAAAGLIFSLFFSPMIEFIDGITIKYLEYYPTTILSLVTFVLSTLTIFLYKNRMFQIRLCTLNAIILLGFQAYIAVKFFTKEENMIYSITAAFPIIAAILTFTALRYIARDEAMVLAASRLRGARKKR